jgi:CHAT domain-containing protein
VADADAAASVAIERARHGGTPEWEITTLIERASLFEKASRPGAALADLEAATVAIEHRRAKLAPSDFLKRGFADQYQTVMSRTIALLNAAGRPRDAMMLAEQGRARAFLDLLASRESAASITLSTTNTPPASADRSASAIEGLTLRGGAAPGRDATDLASVASAQGPTQQTLQSAASRLKSTLLMYWVADDATLVWVLPPTGTVTSRRIAITRSRLERLVRRTWSLSPGALARRGFDDEPTDAAAPAAGDRALPFVTMRGGDPMRSSGLESSAYRELYDLLIAPIRDALPKTPESLLTIVPHGPLFELSFAALADARGRYLLEDHRLHYAPSAATLEFTARRAEQPQRNSRYLFVANPATTVQVAAQPLAALPGAEREVRAVSRLVGASRSTTFSGKAASEDAIRGAIGQYRVVHFATHGLVSSDNPFESFLALAPGAGGDGRLTAAEIHEMTITADLVVLSACRAAGGKISGDGIVGLSRAFFTAGTPSIVAALWDMADESAEHLLPRFYADWQKTGDKGRALRSAQLSMLRDLRAGKLTVQTPFGALVLPPHPALWANLILIGEPR